MNLQSAFEQGCEMMAGPFGVEPIPPDATGPVELAVSTVSLALRGWKPTLDDVSAMKARADMEAAEDEALYDGFEPDPVRGPRLPCPRDLRRP